MVDCEKSQYISVVGISDCSLLIFALELSWIAYSIIPLSSEPVATDSRILRIISSVNDEKAKGGY